MNTSKILDAVLFASTAHAGQVRKFEQNEPYVNHVIRVAKTVAKLEGIEPSLHESMIIAALLHDTLEDCPQVTYNQIRARYGQVVANFVNDLTNVPLSEGNRATRKEIDRNRLSLACAEVHTIKCADIIDNVPSIVANDKNFGPRFISEVQESIKVLDKADQGLYLKAKAVIYDGWVEVNRRVSTEIFEAQTEMYKQIREGYLAMREAEKK